MAERVVLIFIDGLGVGCEDENRNPMARVRGGCLSVFSGANPAPALAFQGIARPLDACLGVEGLPQSATGQTALLTGVNAPKILGRHLFGFPNRRLREIILEKSLLKRAVEAGKKSCFLNAFRPPFFELGEAVWEAVPLSVTTWTNRAANIPFFSLEDLRAGRSLYQDFTNRSLIKRGFEAPLLTPAEAGGILARCGEEYELLLYEYFRTDAAGHSRNMEKAEGEIRRLEEFLQAFLARYDLARTLVVLSSDHGNIEDLSTRGHTRNEALTVLWGAGAREAARGLETIADVPGMILKELGGEPRRT